MSCFELWAMYTCKHLTLPNGPVSLHRLTQSISIYVHSWFNSQRRRVPPPPFPIWVCYLSIPCIYCHNINNFMIKGTVSWWDKLSNQNGAGISHTFITYKFKFSLKIVKQNNCIPLFGDFSCTVLYKNDDSFQRQCWQFCQCNRGTTARQPGNRNIKIWI